jgi:hypothetical protein
MQVKKNIYYIKMKYQNFIKINKQKSGYYSREIPFRKDFEIEYLEILKYTEKFKNSEFKEKLYRFFKKDLEEKKCICGKNQRFLSIEKGYQKYCSSLCANKNSNNLIKKVKLEKYGDPNYNNKEKFKKTISSKTEENKMETLEKRRKTKLEKYGDPNFTNVDKIAISKKLTTINQTNEKIEKYKVRVLSLNKDFSYQIICEKCGEENMVLNSRMNHRIRKDLDPCIKCNNIYNGISEDENNLSDFIENLGVEIIKGDRKILDKSEIDILIPGLKLGIEYNGLYWHSEMRVSKRYHLEKSEKALERGVKLIHIWEDDWEEKKPIVISRIKQLLGKTENTIFARKCSVKELTFLESKKFLNENHIQGFCPFQISIGLYYKEDLISIATFGNRKISGSKGNELLRFCNKVNYNIPGGFSKIFNYYIKKYDPESIITFADRSWTASSDNFYTKNGFEFIGATEPNYWYIIEKKRKHRFSFRKDKLIKEGFDPDKTEKQIMEDRGILRIYDCGQYKYKWEKKLDI